MQWAATLRATCDVDVQQDKQPLSGVRLLVCHRRPGSRQSTAVRQSLPFDAVGQQAVVANGKETIGQHVLEKAVEERLGGKNVRLPAISVAAVSVSVTDLTVLAVQRPEVADRDAMCVAGPGTHRSDRRGTRRCQEPSF